VNILSLFAGIGGLELGLERAGLGTTRWQVELEPFNRKVLAAHWPDAERFADVRDVSAEDFPGCDVICGGFPCQDISSAGKGEGIDGQRSGLWREFARLIGEIRPRIVVVENVPDLAFEDSDASLETFARSGTMRSGKLYQRKTPVRLTSESDSSSSQRFATPTRKGNQLAPSMLAKHPGCAALLPTPTASHYGTRNNGRGGDGTEFKTKGSPSLSTMAKRGMLPTPTARDWEDGTAKSCQNVPVNALLGRAVHHLPNATPSPGGKLNPRWVQWLMGFPAAWLNCVLSETRSSRKSRSSSEEEPCESSNAAQ